MCIRDSAGTRGGSSVVGAMDMYVPFIAREEVQHVEMLKFGYGRVPFLPSPLQLYSCMMIIRMTPINQHRLSLDIGKNGVGATT